MIHFFISYDRDDSGYVSRLCNLLMSQGFKLWWDVTGLPPGTSDWQIKIEDAIEKADALIVVLSPNAKESRWVRMEVKYGDMMGKQIIPVLGRGDERTSVPIELVNNQWVDYRIESKEQADKLILELRNIVNSLSRKRHIEVIMRGLAHLREYRTAQSQRIGVTSTFCHFWNKTEIVIGYRSLIQVFWGKISVPGFKNPEPLILRPEHHAYLTERGWVKEAVGGFDNTCEYWRIWELWSYAVDAFPRDKSVEEIRVAEAIMQVHENLGVDIEDSLASTLGFVWPR